MKRIDSHVLAVAVLLWTAEAAANNDLSTSHRAGTISPPSVESAATSDAATVGVNQGRASYSIPIVAPPGRAGLEPDLQLRYVGTQTESVVGTGWQLAVPRLRVRTAGRGGQPEYGVGVTYLGFSGEDLVEAGTLADSDGDALSETIWREERDLSFIRYVQLSAGGWRADYPDGRKLKLGVDPHNRIVRTGVSNWIAEWLPETLEDPSGNQLMYVWSDARALDASALSSTARYLTAIEYGCQACASAPNRQVVRFAYAKRAMPLLDFAPGFAVETELLLTRIQTATSIGGRASLVRSVALSHDVRGTRTLLSRVQVSAADGTTLPPLVFTYTDGDAPSTFMTALSRTPSTTFKSGIQLFDADLDGRVDVVDLSSAAAAKWYPNQGEGVAAWAANALAISSPPGQSLSAQGSASLHDANRDLAFDVLDLSGSRLYVHNGNPGWDTVGRSAALPAIAFSSDTLSIDVDRDGHVDLVDTSLSPWTIHFDDGSGNLSAESVNCSGSTPTFGAPLRASSDGVLSGDVNGDGLVDIVYVSPLGTEAHVFYGRGRYCWGFLTEDGHGALAYDTLPLTSRGGSPVRSALSFADVSGDGFEDLVMLDAAGGRLNVWLFAPGRGWSDADSGGPFVQGIAAVDGCRVGDVDGDAVDEVLCSNGWRLYDWAAQPRYLLEHVANGLGSESSLAYTTSPRVAAAHRTRGVPWQLNIATSLPIIAAVELSDGRGGVLVDRYDYRNASMELDELEDRAEFAGFEYISVTSTAYLQDSTGARSVDRSDPGRMIRTWYDRGASDWYLHGSVLCEETWPAAARPGGYDCGASTGALRRRELVYAVDVDPAHQFATIQLAAEDHYILEGGTQPARVRTEHAYDDYGNLTLSLAWGLWDGAENSAGADEQAVANDWILDTGDWNLRLRKRERRGAIDRSGARPTVRTEQSTFHRYDGSSQWDVSDVTRGLQTATDRLTRDPRSGVDQIDTVELRTYTTRGLPDLITDAASSVTDLDYDPDFELFLAAETRDPGGLNLVTRSTVDPRSGVITSLSEPDGTTTHARYDLLGRVTQLVKPGDSVNSPTLTRSYLMTAPTWTVSEVQKDGTPDGLVTRSLLDGQGRLLCRTREAIAGQVDVELQREYSARSHVALEYLPLRAAGCDTPSLSAGRRTTGRAHDARVVDALGRLRELIHRPSGAQRRVDYGVLEVRELDEEDTDAASAHAASPTVRQLDGRGRVTRVIETIDTNADGVSEPYATHYAWTALDQLAAVVDPLGASLLDATYDSRGRRIRTTDPDRGTIEHNYDAMDRLETSLDARQAGTSFSYDAAGRVLRVQESERGVTVTTTDYHYDVPAPGYAAPECNYHAGRLAYVDDATGRSVFCYDPRGNVTRLDKRIDALSQTPLRLERSFDALDRVQTLTHPDGTRLSYQYGSDGRAARLRIRGGPSAAHPTYDVVSAAVYNGAGQPTEIDLGNGAELRFDYDDRSRPLRSRAGAGTTTHQDLTLALDALGNVTSIVDGANSELSAAFTYDDLYRLTSASGDRYGGFEARYAYDLRGNLIEKSSTDPAGQTHIGQISYRSDRIHAVDQAAGQTFAYDATGNLVDDGTHTFSYTPRGMLQRVSRAGTTLMTNHYDYAQRRVVKEGSDPVYSLPEAGLQIRRGEYVKTIGFAGRTVLRLSGTFDAASYADKARFLVTDHLGSPTQVLDTNGSVVERWASHPYGEENRAPIDAAGFGAHYFEAGSPSSALEFRFQGREINAEDDSYDFGARVYRADLGRFMSPDSIVPDPTSSQSWNRYAFVRNNPLAWIDPTGHADEPATQSALPVPTTTEVIEIHDTNGRRTSDFTYPTPSSPASAPAAATRQPSAAEARPPLSYDRALRADQQPAQHQTWQENRTQVVGHEATRVAQVQGSGRSTVGISDSNNRIVNRVAGERSLPMRFLGLNDNLQAFSALHDVQAASAQTAPRDFTLAGALLGSAKYQVALVESAIAGGAVSIVKGPEAGAKVAEFVWRDLGFNP